jgi:hemoglobin-like flavoprotein
MSAATPAPVAEASPRRAPAAAPIALTAKQKRLIRESVLKLEPAFDLVGQLFFLKLYRLDPTFRVRFAGPAETQGRKFMAALKLAIISLNYEDGLAPTLRLLGVRHRQLGIKIRHYRMMTKALIWTLEQSLETRFTRETKDAWSALLTQLTRTLSGGNAALLRSVGGTAA